MKHTIMGITCALVLGGCMGSQPGQGPGVGEVLGTVGGAVAGGVIGNKIGDGSGQKFAIAIGAMAGGLAGNWIGRNVDENTRRKQAEATIESLDRNEAITWSSPQDSGDPVHGEVLPTRTGQTDDGRTCREFQQTVTIGGREEQSYGTACRDENGDWKIVSS